MDNIIYELDLLDGHAFEDAMAILFQRLGYSVTRTPKSGDEGRDLILQKQAETIIVECKHQASLVGRPIVQKLHSAVSTYPGAQKGIIATSNSFSKGAIEYTRKLEHNTGIEILLWDYNSLIYRAKQVNVFLTSSQQSTSIYFHVPARSDAEIARVLRQQYVSRLISHPLPSKHASTMQIDAHELVPVVLVNYEVEKIFSTQVGVIHKVSDRGRRFYEIRRNSLSPKECDYWINSNVRECAMPSIEGKKLPTYFGKPLNGYTLPLATSIARKHSKTVCYSGKNNRSYSKHCEIKPAEVNTNAQQVLLSKWRVNLFIGPKRYEIILADDAEKVPLITSTSGFGHGEGVFLNGTGMICNDCAQIVPRTGCGAGVVCASCKRTLCERHRWQYPTLLPFRSFNYCSRCYKSLPLPIAAFCQYPEPWRNFASLILISLMPGLPFLLGRRPFLGILCAVTTILIVALTYKSSWLWPALSTAIAIDICIPVYWCRRVHKHRSNLKNLNRYTPEWCD